MRILLATDGSRCSQKAVRALSTRDLPDGTEIRIVSVANPHVQFAQDALMLPASCNAEVVEARRELARRAVEVAAAAFRYRPELQVRGDAIVGPVAEAILRQVDAWKPDLLVMGSHGGGIVRRLLHGSTSHAIAGRAGCPVEIVGQ
jgi:nucleotide-binding universal stress UspA family protein